VELAQSGKVEEARAEFLEAIKINPRYALAYLNRGLSRLAQGSEDEAERDFHRCIELDDRLKRSVEENITEVRRHQLRQKNSKLQP